LHIFLSPKIKLKVDMVGLEFALDEHS
jgi:hypothetical protein